jgi:flagellin-specific chaperone FliS
LNEVDGAIFRPSSNMKNDVAALEEVKGFVTEFRNIWKEVIQESIGKTI